MKGCIMFTVFILSLNLLLMQYFSAFSESFAALRWNALRNCQFALSIAIVPLWHFDAQSFVLCYSKLLRWLELEKLVQERDGV